MFFCPYCNKTLQTPGGVDRHVTQTPACLLIRNTQLLNQDGSEMDIDDREGPGNSVGDNNSSQFDEPPVLPTPPLPHNSSQSDEPLMPPTPPSPIRPEPYYHVHSVPGAAQRGSKEGTRWETTLNNEHPEFPFHPWASEVEFELVEWLTLSKISASAIDEFLRLKFVRIIHIFQVHLNHSH